MYTDHFKLSEQPFNHCPGTGVFTPNDEFESAVARMEQVLLSRNAVAVVTGGPGVGKTTIVAAAARRANDKAMVAYVDMRLIDPDLLYDLLLLNLGEQSTGGDLATALYQLKSTIARQNDEQGCNVTAVIDVSSLTIERAKRILQLIHMAGEPGGQLNVVLLGPHILHKLLDTPGLIHMRQRVTFRHRVRPLTVAETEAYIAAELERAGGQVSSMMDHGTSIVVYRYVGGVPRLINTLMDATLSYAAEKGIESVAPDMIKEVTQLLGWRRLSGKKSPAEKTNAPAPGFNRKQEDPSPLEISSAESAPPKAVKTSPAADTAPVSEGTAILMASALEAEKTAVMNAKPELKLEETGAQPATAKESGVPEMDSSDTSATGMLRLEDLDARFAETVFGDDTGMFKIDGEAKKAVS